MTPRSAGDEPSKRVKTQSSSSNVGRGVWAEVVSGEAARKQTSRTARSDFLSIGFERDMAVTNGGERPNKLMI